MEKGLFTRTVAAVLMAVVALMPASMSAYDFEEGGIFYNVSGNQATVTYRASGGNSYSGNVAIPETVTHNGVTYSVTAIGHSAFSRSSSVTAVEIPNSVVSVGEQAFAFCTGLREVVIPNSVETLGRCSFHTCSALLKAVIGNRVKVVEEYAFQYCNNLTEVVLGSSVDSLGLKAFYDCSDLVKVTCLALTPPKMYATYSFYDPVYNNGTLYVLGSAVQAYKADSFWQRFRKIENLTITEQLSLDKSMLTLHGGESQQLIARILPADASQALRWTSDDVDVATVDADGVVSAVGPGQTTITAATTDGSGLSATCHVRVLSYGVQDNNVLTIPGAMTVEKGTSCLLPVAMVNNASISAIQFDLGLCDGIGLATDDNGYLIDLLESRGSASHVVYAREIGQNVIRVVVTSPQSESFTGNEGDLLSLHLNISEDMVVDAEYDITLSNVVLADADALTYYAPEAVMHMLVTSYAKGDANGDKTVNVGDYVTVANYILKLNPEPFIFSAADVDENQTIDVGDLVGVANIVLGDFTMPENAPRYNDMDVNLTGESVSDGDGRVVVTLNMDNEVALTAWQMNVALPQGMKLAQATLSSRASHHSLAMNEQAGGRLTLLGSSMVNDLVDGNEGALLTLVLEGNASDGATLTVSDAVLAEADMTTHVVNPFQVNIGNSAVKEMNSDVRIYARGTDIIVETPVDTTVELVHPNGMTRMLEAKAGVNTYRDQQGLCIVRAAGQVAKLSLR